MFYPTPMPPWLTEAFKHIGLKEIPGKNHSPTILKWLATLKAWWKDDETPWCGVYVAWCLRSNSLPVPKYWMRAKEYSSYGTPCNKTSIPFGSIAVKSRKGGGHVFFPIAQSRDGQTIYGLGANRSVQTQRN